jgi:hypothetical protein
MWRGILCCIALGIVSDSGGQPTGTTAFITASFIKDTASPSKKIWTSWPASANAFAWRNAKAAFVGSSDPQALLIRIFIRSPDSLASSYTPAGRAAAGSVAAYHACTAKSTAASPVELVARNNWRTLPWVRIDSQPFATSKSRSTTSRSPRRSTSEETTRYRQAADRIGGSQIVADLPALGVCYCRCPTRPLLVTLALSLASVTRRKPRDVLCPLLACDASNAEEMDRAGCGDAGCSGCPR